MLIRLVCVRRADDNNVVQTTMLAAVYGPFLAVPTQEACRMDPLASSCSLVPADAARKAVGTWAAQRHLGGQQRDLLVLVSTQCGTQYSREGDTERPGSFRMMVEA